MTAKSGGRPIIKVVDLTRVWAEIREDALAAIDRVGTSGWFILGSEVERFESVFARMVRSVVAVGCASGTDAIELSLRAAGLQPGESVVTTPLSAFATTTGILRAGGVPVYVDTDDDGNVNLDELAAWASNRSDRSFAVPVHLYGNPLDIDRLTGLADDGVVIIEDCAQALGAMWDGLAVGAAGVAAAYSFYPTKNVGAMGDAGAVATDSREIAKRLVRLRDYGQTAKYVHAEFGVNSRMDEIQAAMLADGMIHRSGGWLERRRHVARRYLMEIEHPSLRCIEPDPRASPAWHLFPVFVRNGSVAAFRSWLRDYGVETGRHYPTVIPDQAAIQSIKHEVVRSLTTARGLSDSEVSLPLHPYLSDPQVDRVIEAVNSWRA